MKQAEIIALAMTVSLISFAIVLLIARRTERRDQTYFLAAFLFICLLNKADALSFMIGSFQVLTVLAGLVFPTSMLLGPAIYFYSRSATSATPRPLTRRDIWALAGPLVLTAIIFEFYFWSPEDKILMFTEQFTPEILEWLNRTCKLIYLWFFIFSIGCLAGAFSLLLRHTKTVRGLFSNIEDKSLNWLRWTLLALAIGWAWYVLSGLWAMQGSKPAWVDSVTAFFELAWISAIAFCGLMQRPIYSRADVTLDPPPVEAAKYARSALSGERMTRIAARLDLAMTEDKLFKEPTLSLRALSEHLGISEYYISQTLNEKLETNFFDFVNAHRVTEAQRRLAETDDLIKTIAHDVGFNSRSTFNTAFTRHTRTTPSRYRSSMRSGTQEFTNTSPS